MQVLETNRDEDSESHIHRMYFMGSNSFGEPWHLPHSPPDQIAGFVYVPAYLDPKMNSWNHVFALFLTGLCCLIILISGNFLPKG